MAVGNFLQVGHSKADESKGEVLLKLYCGKSCFWVKVYVAFGPFGWLVAEAKAG